MNRNFIFIILFFSLSLNSYTQDTKYIEVTGSAEMFIEPDEFIYIIRIEEYWKDEYWEQDTVTYLNVKKYKNKVLIKDIETPLLEKLSELGLEKKNIRITEIGNYRGWFNNEMLISKQIELTLKDFKTIDTILSKLDKKGIDYINIGELKNKELSNYRKEVKKRALKEAKEKAEYLLESIDKKLGGVISITEIETQPNYWSRDLTMSNSTMSSPDNKNVDNDKKIKLRFEIKARFEIESK